MLPLLWYIRRNYDKLVLHSNYKTECWITFSPLRVILGGVMVSVLVIGPNVRRFKLG